MKEKLNKTNQARREVGLFLCPGLSSQTQKGNLFSLGNFYSGGTK